MKRKYNLYLKKTLLGLILVAVMSPALRAATILPDANGNIVITDPAEGGDHNIETGDGIAPAFPSGYHDIIIGSGVTLNPDGFHVINIGVHDETNIYYIIGNSGSLIADADHVAIITSDEDVARPSIDVHNYESGVISGGRAIVANNRLNLTNSGQIIGTEFLSQVISTEAGGNIFNYEGGVIRGAGTNIFGGEGDLNIYNDGLIDSENLDGIFSRGQLYVLNGSEDGEYMNTPTIQGGNLGVVSYGADSRVVNFGLISGVGGGVSMNGANGRVDNYGRIQGAFGGVIMDSENGILKNEGTISGNDPESKAVSVNQSNVTIENTAGSVITGGYGIHSFLSNGLWIQNEGEIRGGHASISIVGNEMSVDNFVGGEIYGSVLVTGDDADIVNNGIIDGGLEDGISLRGDSGRIENTGEIRGGKGIQVQVEAGESFQMVNTGQLIGDNGVAFESVSDGNVLLNFLGGTEVTGDIQLGGGDDTVIMNAIDGPVVIYGSIDGGVGGTSKINLIGGMISPTEGYHNMVSGNVRVDEIYKLANGDAWISGETVADLVEVSEGSLHLLGGATIDEIVLQNGGMIGGVGEWTIGGSLTVSNSGGVIGAGWGPVFVFDEIDQFEAIGHLTINGNVVSESYAVIWHDLLTLEHLGLGTSSDLITHRGGSFDLGSFSYLAVSPLDNTIPLHDGTYVVVDSDSAILGGLPYHAVRLNVGAADWTGPFIGTRVSQAGDFVFDAAINSFIQTALSEDGTDLVFHMERDYEGIGAMMGSGFAAFGAGIDGLANSDDPLLMNFVSSLDYSDLETVAETIASLSPTDAIALSSSVINSNYRLHRMMESRLAAARRGDQLGFAPKASSKGQIPSSMGSAERAAPSVGLSGGSVWGSYSYDSLENSDFKQLGYDGDTGSFSAGVDYRMSSDFLFGVLLDGSKSDFNPTLGGADIDSFRLGLYGTYGRSLGFYSDFLLGYGSHDLEIDRVYMGLPGLGGTTGRVDTEADSLQAYLSVGYAMRSQNVKHGPFAALEYQKMDVDGFVQTGLMPVSVADYDVTSFRLMVGYRAETKIERFTPYVSVAYAHEFEDGPVRAMASLAGSAPFQVTGGNLDSAVLINVGTEIELSPSWSANLGYRGEISVGDGYDSHGGTVGLSFSF